MNRDELTAFDRFSIAAFVLVIFVVFLNTFVERLW